MISAVALRGVVEAGGNVLVVSSCGVTVAFVEVSWANKV